MSAVHKRIVDGLNARFAAGGPVTDLAHAGVFMRAFDGLNDRRRPWQPCTGCPSSDRFPSSLIYPKHTDIYSSGPGGFVIHPSSISVFCSCYADCGSQGKSCTTRYGDDTCTPGCARPCDPARGVRNWGCAWYGNEQLHFMMEQQMVVRAGGGYNEVVLDPRAWVATLPTTVEALFVLPISKPQDIQNIHQTRTQFLEEYRIASDDGPPIVIYAPQDYPEAPFRRYD